MYFTREPIVESVVTPKEGCKLVVRNSKGVGQEEFFVDAIEVVNFGSALFFRSLEKPKSFLLPVSDYELLEVRETRVVLRHAAGGEKAAKPSRARKPEKAEPTPKEAPAEKKKKERRQRRRKTTKDETEPAAAPAEGEVKAEDEADFSLPDSEKQETPPDFSALSSILPPPSFLISEKIDQYKEMVDNVEEAPAPKDEVPEEGHFDTGVFADEGGDEEKRSFSPGSLLRRFRGKEGEESEEAPAEEATVETEES